MSGGRVMIVGAVGSGKSTLIKALNRSEGGATKTQSLVFDSKSIDTPGEYMENPFFYRALFATSLEADTLVFIQDATRNISIFPPGFAGAFTKRTIGVVSKLDHPEANVDRAKGFLKSLGLSGPVAAVSALQGNGMEQLRELLKWDQK